MRTFISALAITLALTASISAAPVVAITAPKANANLTNGSLLAAGTAKGSSPIKAVYYSLNGNAPLPASGTTNWSANLSLAAGLNSLSVYALDNASVMSRTNKVTFTYVVNYPVALTISPSNTWGSASVTNGQPLQIGKTYSVTARAAQGFKFSHWMCDGTNLPGASPTVKFVMSSNLALKASFADITKPLCVIAQPAVGHNVTNSVVGAIRVRDTLVGVGAVFYQFNGNGWVPAHPAGDGTNWATASLTVTAGNNVLQAFASNNVGLLSLTNTVKFKGVIATPAVVGLTPSSLAGMAGMVTNEDGTVEEISFGEATYAISSFSTTNLPRVGSYIYTRLNTNTAQLSLLADAPANKAGDVTDNILVFSRTNVFAITNTDSGLPLVISLFPVSTLAPLGSASVTTSWWDGNGNSGTNVFAEGVFTNVSNRGTNWGTYCAFRYSPIVVLRQQTYTDLNLAGDMDYKVLTYTGDGEGTYFNPRFDSANTLISVSLGNFSRLTSGTPSGGNSPASLSGKVVKVTKSGKPAFYVTFGDSTYSVFDSYTNQDNSSVGVYSYIKTGANTGRLTLIDVAPWQDTATNESSMVLTFTSSALGTGANQKDGGSFSFATSAAQNYAPDSVAGKAITVAAGKTGTFDNFCTLTATKSGGGQEILTYAYARFSPDGGMLFLTHSDGGTVRFQLRFTSATAGQWYETDFDSGGNRNGVASGSFTLK